MLCIDKGPRMFRDRKPICNVLRGGFEILNSEREGEVVDYPSTSSVSAPPFRDSFLQDNNVTLFFYFFYRAFSNPPLVKFVETCPRYEINFSTLGISNIKLGRLTIFVVGLILDKSMNLRYINYIVLRDCYVNGFVRGCSRSSKYRGYIHENRYDVFLSPILIHTVAQK